MKKVNALNSLIRTVTKEAYELADKRSRLPERITVKASFDMDHSGPSGYQYGQ